MSPSTNNKASCLLIYSYLRFDAFVIQVSFDTEYAKGIN